MSERSGADRRTALTPPRRATRDARRGRRPPGHPRPVDLALTPAQLELQARARAYVVDCLQPLEVEFERAGGRLPRGDPRAPEAGGDRRAARRRAAAPGGRRPGLDGGRAGPRPRAARPGDRRAVVVHPGRLQRARPRRRGPAPALPRAEPARRAVRQLRDHRARTPAPTRGRSSRRPSATPRPATTSSTARSGS